MSDDPQPASTIEPTTDPVAPISMTDPGVVAPPLAAPEEEASEPFLTQVAAERLRPHLAQGFRAFEGQELAVLRWLATGVKRADGTEERGGVSISITTVRVSRQGGITLVMQWQPENASPATLDVPVNLYAKKDAISFRATIFKKARDWTLVRDSVVDPWSNGESIESAYSNPRGTPGLELLGETWFSPGQKRKRGGVRAIVCSPSPSLAKLWATYSDDAWTVPLPGLPTDPCGAKAAEIAAAMLAYIVWATMVQLFQGETAEGEAVQFKASTYGLPSSALYWPRRPVDLNPNEVREHLESREGLRLPWHLIEAACSSLNAGKHVIFTGPPGCGKSKLAIALAKLAKGGVDPLTVTASPAWSSGDLIGRYMPRLNGHGLVFKPGFFLKAVDEDRWLVIDEFNRADIDQCFGELFSVLASDAVTLPFEDALEDGSQVPIRILPAKGQDAMESSTVGSLPAGERFRAYRVSPAFRLLGTMNDADRSSLSQLSFALLRRFDVIRVEAPPPDTVAKIIQARVRAADEALGGHQYLFKQDTKWARQLGPVTLESIRESLLNRLFARTHRTKNTAERDGGFSDLVAERVIGLATVQDVVQFVAEGLRRPDQSLKDGDPRAQFVKLSKEDVDTKDIQPVAASYLAMGIVLSVFPQLDALKDERLERAVGHILDAFADVPFKRIQLNLDPATRRDFPYTLEHVDAESSGIVDADGNGKISAQEFLLNELCLQYRGTPWELRLRAMLPAKDSEVGGGGTSPA